MAARKPAGELSRLSSSAARRESRSRPPTLAEEEAPAASLCSPTFTTSLRLARGSRGLMPAVRRWRASSDAPMRVMSTMTGAPDASESGTFPSRFCMRSSLRVAEFHRFLMALSVRPGMSLTISAHFVPCSATACRISRSSSSVKFSFFTSGERWLCQRSRHCLPTRPGRCCAIWDQEEGPYWATILSSLASSSGVHTIFLIARAGWSGPHSSPAAGQ
mmetsp:Transcript_6373/g.21123  ORF Transcript_6373/g.21123 Transcript_6373/m.21123 type:complete len:218 (+) Transcript_6373:910-1563(+)